MVHKLLLADDSVTIQRVIELTFADEDIEVLAVGDGQQAIDRIKADRPDIVLADVGMPERDGFEVAAFVKQDPDLCHIPVLLLTGAFEPVDEDRVRAVGCDGVLAKPFEPQLLIERVKQLLETPPGERKMAEPSAGAAPVAFDDTPLVVPPATPPPDIPGNGHGLDDLSLSASGESESRGSLDEYFDRLDAAFASAGKTVEPPPVPAALPDAAGWPAPEERSWSAPASPALPAVEPPPRAADGAPAAPSSPSQRGTSDMPPQLADAFDWLLAAEQGQPLPADAFPASGDRRAAAIDSIADELTRRVIERLADRSVRDEVVEIVSSVAERLVREEIERLKGLK